VSPLTALKDQVSSISKFGLSAAYLSGASLDAPTKDKIKNGEYQIMFSSPETFCLTMEWKNLLLSIFFFKENIVGFVIDEAHCIKQL